MKYKQEGLQIVTYREPEPRRIDWYTAASVVVMLVCLLAIGNLCVAFGF